MSQWYFCDVLLDDLGIVTAVSDSHKTVEKRGENIVIPFHYGRVWNAKYFDERALTLGLEIVTESIAALEDAIDTVKALLGRSTLGELKQVMENGSVRIGYAEHIGDLGTTRSSPNSEKILLELRMPDPFFYAETITEETYVINTSPKTITMNNSGTVEERKPIITLTGPLEDVQIANETNGVTLNYSGVVPAGETVIISRNIYHEYTALWGAVNVIGRVSHSGSSAFMILSKGDNTIKVYSDLASTGSVKFSFYAPYL